MNVGNATTMILTEGKNQNIALGKLGIQAMQARQVNQINQTALNSNQLSDAKGEMSLGQSLFKQLLLSSPNLKAALLKANQTNQVNRGRVGEIIDKLAVDEEIENAVDGKDNCQVMSSMDIKMILNNGNLNKIDLKLKETILSGGQAAKCISAVEAGTIISENKAEKIAPKEKTSVIEMKQLNQGVRTDLKVSGQGGVGIASPNNGKEIKVEKLEVLTGIKEKNEEKSIIIENGEMISSINKPGNIVNDKIEVNLKNQNLENVPVYNQIAEEIASKLEQKGPAEFKLQLKPENLGEIDISIKISEGKLSIDIISANTKTQDLLVSQVDKLVAKLGLQNFQIENIQVNPGTTAGTTNHDATNQAAMLNLGMNFSDRRQQENLKQQSILKKELKGISGLSLDGKELNNSIEVSRGIDFSKHKINYAI